MRREYQWPRLIDYEFEEMRSRNYSLREEMENSNCAKYKVTRSQNIKDPNFTVVKWRGNFFLKGKKCETRGDQNRLQISADKSLLQLEITFANSS